MQCNDTLWEVQEPGVDPAWDEDLRLHLASCPACGARMSALHDAVLLLKTAPSEAPDPGFADRVLSRIALERVGEGVQIPSTRVTVIGLAVIVAALVALAMLWASSEAFMSLQPGSTILVGMTGLVTGLANVLVRLSAVARSFIAAARSLPPEFIQAIEYSIQLCCVLAFITMLWMAGRGRKPSGAGIRQV